MMHPRVEFRFQKPNCVTTICSKKKLTSRRGIGLFAFASLVFLSSQLSLLLKLHYLKNISVTANQADLDDFSINPTRSITTTTTTTTYSSATTTALNFLGLGTGDGGNGEGGTILRQDIPHPAMKCCCGNKNRNDNAPTRSSNSDQTQQEQQQQQQQNEAHCCVPWTVNVDDWWTHHPDWGVSLQNTTHHCFSKYPEPKASFLRKLYRLQWISPPPPLVTDDDTNSTTTTSLTSNNNTNNHNNNDDDDNDDGLDIYNQYDSLPPTKRNCSNLWQNYQVGSGLGASLATVMNGFKTAFNHNRPYQLNKYWEGFVWSYAAATPQEDNNNNDTTTTNNNDTTNNTSWAWCPSTDLNCYILPISNCINNYTKNDGAAPVGRKGIEAQWMRDYLLRFRHEMRWRIQTATEELVQKARTSRTSRSSTSTTIGEKKKKDIEQQDTTTLLDNCTLIHVRRGDSALKYKPYRRYAALSEYLEAGNVDRDNEVIFLLSDDWTTIYEAEQFYPDYNIVYMDRPRVNMTYGGKDGHRPSGDAPREFVTIQAESAVAANCWKQIHGNSGFMVEVAAIRQSLGLPPPTSYTVNTKIRKWEVDKYLEIGPHKRAEVYMEKIFREAAEGLRKRQQQQKQQQQK